MSMAQVTSTPQWPLWLWCRRDPGVAACRSERVIEGTTRARLVHAVVLLLATLTTVAMTWTPALAAKIPIPKFQADPSGR